MQRRSLLSLPFFLPAVPEIVLAKPRGGKPKNIIYLVSDGMSHSVLMMAEYLSRMSRQKGTRWAAMINDANATNASQDVASLSSPVTDSAASASAWGSGSRVANAAINVLPDGTRLEPILKLAKARGLRTGLVTTATVTHATPAGFAAIEPRRDNEEGIALQYKGVVDVVLGGGQKFYLPNLRKDKRDVPAEYKQAGYQFATTRAELLGASVQQPILGVFSPGHIPYSLDQLSMPTPPPTLSEMTKFALDALTTKGSKGFVLQVEGGRVDHAAHDNDIAALLWDQLAFDDALGLCLDFAARRGDTLVVVTTDHGNSTPGFNGMGTEYKDSKKCFERLLQAKASFEVLPLKLPQGKPGAANFWELIKTERGLDFSEREGTLLADSFAGVKGLSLNARQDNFKGVLGQLLGNHYGVGFTGMDHTGEYVQMNAYGPGAAPFAGFVSNTDVFPTLTSYLGIKHRNPTGPAT
ncbi:MAG: alkaline phosphatase [Bryobacter sp.]|nr:alkaline phosphatase [Bryobacter sp.]